MTFEEASDMYAMYSIDPQLTCQCDEFHICQQCHEDSKIEMKKIMKNSFNLTWYDPTSGHRIKMENMSSKFLVNYITMLGEKCIEPEITVCSNQEYLGEPK